MTNRMLRYLLVVASIVIGMFALITPKPIDNESEFSAERAFDHIEQIAKVPHTIEDKDALEDVREYLVSQLNILGVQNEITTYTQEDDEYDITEVNNILVTIPGESDSYILLVAHYDSSPAKRIGEETGSLGAADDGYGLSTILETLNVLLKNNVELKNGIKVLFSDAEEIGLYGAKREVERNPSFFSDVAIVINIEARGVKGPSIMFQTSLDNYKVMKFYQKADYPVSFSLAGDVYSRMPNSTDFTPMLEEGLVGLNMAVLDNLDYYHTPKDNPDNVNMSSLQHYGAVIYPLVKEFVTNEDYGDVNYFESTKGATYFTLLPNIFVVYSTTTQLVLVILTLAIFFINIYDSIKDKEIIGKRLLKCTGVWTLVMILLLIDGLIVSLILSWISGIPFSLTYMPKVPLALGFMILIVVLDSVALFYLGKKITELKDNQNSLLYGGLILNAIFMVLFTIVLPGGVYLFMIPLLTANIVLHLIHLLKKKHIGSQRVYVIMESINIIIPLVLFAPIIYLLYLALTIGALAICTMFLVFPFAIVIPTIERLNKI